MAEIHYIKYLWEKEALSIRAISQKLNIDWRTAKKYATEVPRTAKKTSDRRGMMYEGPFGDIVDVWMEEDQRAERKYRRSCWTIFQDLKQHHGFPGSYRTVCVYIQEHRPLLKAAADKQYERLEHPPGEAQVDFGHMKAVQYGEKRNVEALLLSFPYSNCTFAYPLPAENAECFLTGLQALFEQAGGVPRKVRIDNLSAAVVSVGRGSTRKYTDAFLAFQAQYRFDVQACNPASGHEKGHVEKKVGYVRQQWFVPEPVMTTFPALASWLQHELEQDRERLHYKKQQTIASLWKQEETHLLRLPDRPYPINHMDTAVVNKYGEARLDGEQVRIPGVSAKQSLRVEKSWDQAVWYLASGEKLHQCSRPYMGTRDPLPWLDILKQWQCKPRAVPYSRYLVYLPETIQAYLIEEEECCASRVARCRDLIKQGYDWERIASLFQVPGRRHATTAELVAILEAADVDRSPFGEVDHTPDSLTGVETNLMAYNALLAGGVQHE